jgi:hypothetical protein
VDRGTFQPLTRINPDLVYGTVAWSWDRKRLRGLQIDGAKGLFILRKVLSQQVPESLGLLRAQIDSLKISQNNFIG